jgi:type II secretory ATPase GspE/PulE/Tfp pilus assembly ATPase PilB-like protein
LGRLGLFEVLTFDDGLRDIVTSNGSVTDIRRAAAARGVETVRQDGLSKVVDGTTSYLELLRVTG